MLSVSPCRAITFCTAALLTAVLATGAVASEMVGRPVFSRDLGNLVTLAAGVLWLAFFAVGYRDRLMAHIDDRNGAILTQIGALQADLERSQRRLNDISDQIGVYGDGRETDGRVSQLRELAHVSHNGGPTGPIRPMRAVHSQGGTAN